MRERATLWTTPLFDEQTRREVESLLSNPDPTPLVEAFYKDLEFGTGGLRGIMGAGTNRMNRYTVAMATQGLCNYLLKTFPNQPLSVAVGHDCRNNSPEFARTTAEVFSANGVKVYLFESLRPTPEVSFAVRKLGCQSGVMITASHNPKVYNGYKAYWADGAQMIAPHDRNTIAEVAKIRTLQEVKLTPKPELIQTIGEEIDAALVQKVQELVLAPEAIRQHGAMPVVYTPIHGTGVAIIPRALRACGFTNIINVPEQDVVSGDFPTVVSPNPEDPAAMALALKRAQETGAELVLGSDPDGDRIGVGIRTRRGQIKLLSGNQICALLIYYSLERHREQGHLHATDFVVKTIVTTELVAAMAASYGVQLYDCYTGFKWIADVIRKNEGKKRYLGGGEESYGFLREDFIRDKSAVSACCMFCELTAWAKSKGLNVEDLLEQIYRQYGYFLEEGVSVVRQGREGAQEIARMMAEYRAHPIASLDGEPVSEVIDYSVLKGTLTQTGEEFTPDMPTTSNVLQYKTQSGTILSVRPSGTEPKIKYYIGVRLPFAAGQEAQETEAKLRDKIARIRAELNI